MPIQINNDAIIWADDALSVAELPEYRSRHLDRVLGTEELEMDSRFRLTPLTHHSFARFTRHVCTWGGCPYIADNILNANAWDRLRDYVHTAIFELSEGNLTNACEAMVGINGLGTAFASKHLRFLCPEMCAVLDSHVREKCGYDDSPAGFSAYSNDCRMVTQNSAHNGILVRVADVDMAIFARLMGW